MVITGLVTLILVNVYLKISVKECCSYYWYR